MRIRHRRFSPGLGLVALLAVGLLLGVTASALTVKKGQKAIPIEAKDTQGKKLSLKQYAGKLVLLDFWATWCPPCRAEIPVIQKVYKKYHKQGFEVIGMALNDEPSDVLEFVETHKMPWRQVLDQAVFEGRFADKYGVVGIPTAILLGPDGKVLDTLARGERLEPLVARHIKSVTNKAPIKIEATPQSPGRR